VLKRRPIYTEVLVPEMCRRQLAAGSEKEGILSEV